MPSFPLIFPFSFTDTALVAGAIDHEEAGLDRLAEYLRSKDNVTGALQAIFSQHQEMEEALQAIGYYRTIDNSFGQHLDNIGAIVGQPRNGLDDDSYRLYLRVKIRADLSSGSTEDLYEVVGLLLPEDNEMDLENQYPAAFELFVSGGMDDTTAAAMVRFMRTARAAGVRGVLTWGVDAPDDLFAFDDVDSGFDDSAKSLGASSI